LTLWDEHAAEEAGEAYFSLVTWKYGDVANGHVLLDGAWVPVRLRPANYGGPWKPGDLVNGHVFTGEKWVFAQRGGAGSGAAAWRTMHTAWALMRDVWVDSTRAERVPKAPLTRRERADARLRAGKRPKQPRRQMAIGAPVGPRPRSTIQDISYSCIKCGRPLTNPNSQLHRIGTECIKRYGSQARWIANPAYTEWTSRMARSDADRIALQVVYDAEYARTKVGYDEALAVWRRTRAGW